MNSHYAQIFELEIYDSEERHGRDDRGGTLEINEILRHLGHFWQPNDKGELLSEKGIEVTFRAVTTLRA
ncbi:hypothetical protein L596_009200 [Steinernema carpocapsae]|uniref:Uncharacterized protein n=1 Tax=Steinernema carpocapsae TaxID=34508 RepID=A0A4V6A6M6_STECR|nr:hypothetical protein L596_009200 [Steinernema carpocapsae]